MHTAKNIMSGTIPPDQGELFDTLVNCDNVMIERITSSSIIEDKMYIQEQSEWILLLEGNAELEMDNTPVSLSKMDHLFIPARCPHKVTKVTHGTVWLAVHIRNNNEKQK